MISISSISVLLLRAIAVIAEKPPSEINESYDSLNNQEGSSIGWNLTRINGNYPAMPSSEPSLEKYSEDSVVYHNVTGVQAHNLTIFEINRDDLAVRFNGASKSCLKLSGLDANGEIQKCLRNPGDCTKYTWDSGDVTGINNKVSGLSFSIWVNIPKSFSDKKEYIFDTGGNEYGQKGIAIYTIGSLDGRSFTQQIVIIVSTGDKYWKVKLSGHTVPHSWNNIGFRWSPDPGPLSSLGGPGAPYGLQVFVNKTSCAWRRSPLYSTSDPAQTMYDRSALSLDASFGCALNGWIGMQGRIDQPVFWAWFLKDNTKQSDGEYYMKPYVDEGNSCPNQKCAQIQKFDGALSFSIPKQPERISLGSDFSPWQFDLERQYFASLVNPDAVWLDDVSAPKAGCSPFDAPSSWGQTPYYSLRQKIKHPIDCVTTIAQLKDALAIAVTDETGSYTPEALTRAMVRVVNKNMLNDDEKLGYLFREVFPQLIYKLTDDKAIAMRSKGEGGAYGNALFMLSRLQEPSIYKDYWSNKVYQLDANSTLGITELMISFETYLLNLTHHLDRAHELFIETNNTLALISRVKAEDVRGDNIMLAFPVRRFYNETERKTYYKWRSGDVEKLVLAERADQWNDVNDVLIMPVPATNEYDKDTFFSIIRMINKHLHSVMPERIDDRVKGVEGETFFINSRVMTLTLNPPPPDKAIFLKYPIQMIFEHIQPQPERPFKKGAVMCAHWVYDERDTRVGGWDTGLCKIKATNDTHTECECSHMSDYAVLFHRYEPSGSIGDGAYYLCYGLYAVSILCLLIYLFVIISNERLHYELHIIGMNLGFALLFAIIFYLSTFIAHEKRVACLVVSIFMHYNYTAAYAWLLMLAHYIFRAITKGKLGGVLARYCMVAWGLPALVVVIMTAIDVTRYGIGERCLGAQSGYFLWVYVGVFILFAALTCPLFGIAMCNLKRNPIKDVEDSKDVRFALYGVTIMWPLIVLVWIMVILVYLEPQDSPVPDFLFELFNSIQGILVFICLGVLVPSFRRILTCRKDQDMEEEWQAKRRAVFVEYVG